MNKRITSRLLLAIMSILMAVLIVVGVGTLTAPANHEEGVATPDVATRDTAIEVTEPVTTVLTPEESVEHLMCVDIQYKTLESVDDARDFALSVKTAIEMITTEYESGTYTQEELELIGEEKIRLEDIHKRVLSDIEDMLEKVNKDKPVSKPSSNKKPVSKHSNDGDTTATPDEPSDPSSKYKHATKVWNYLKDKGYSDAVCAGIMGNFMAETGGHTLNIKPNDYSSNGRYYGIAQWSAKYYPEVQGKDLDYQLKFLSKTIEKEFNTYGRLYKKGFDYEDFLRLDSPRDAALAFAKVYERCRSGSYSKRQNGAEKALDYFT